MSTFDPNRPPDTGPEWLTNGRASDVPITPGGDPSPFADLDDVPPEEFADPVPPEDEPYPNSDIDTRKVTVTFIRDKTGIEMRSADLTLPQLAEHIRFTTAADKMALPWLKLALFGNKRSEHNSLRTNENVLQISGLEGDHDSGELAFDDARAIMLKAQVRCMLYTSASHVPGTKERWRILVPLSKNYPPEWREKGVARVNGLLWGHLAGESFTKSQGFLYGHLKGAEYRVEVIDGRFLDLRDDLYAGSIFKDGSRVGGNGAGPGIDLNGAGPQHRSRKGDDPQEIDPDKIEAALNVISSDCHYKLVWMRIGGALHYAFGEAGFPLFDRWSAKATGKASDGTPRYTAEKCRESWIGFRSLREYTTGTIYHFADQADPDWLQRYEDEKRQRAYARMAAGAGASNGAGTSGAGAGTGSTGNSSSAGTGAGTASPHPSPISATPYVWTDPSDIPMRDWVYGRLLIRKFVTATVAPGGLGKSSLITVEALSQVSGKDLLRVTPKEQLRVWLWNLEDPQEETERKIQAAAKHYGLKPEDIGNRLFVDSGRDRPLVIATVNAKGGPMIVRPVVDALVAEIIDKQIDVLTIDPFVSCHELPENDNTAQDMVVKEWGRVAELGNCAVHLVDHTRKMNGSEAEVTTESSRGAKAKTDAARVVRVVNRMSKDEGEKSGVENHRLYFRTYNDKANLAPPADKSDWFELKSVDLGNGPRMVVGGVSFSPGDSVGVVNPWEWPDPLAGMTGADFDKAAAAIRGGKWRKDPQCKDWVGHAVAKALKLAGNKSDKAKVAGLVKVWLASGALVEVTGKDAKRNDRQFIEVADEE